MNTDRFPPRHGERADADEKPTLREFVDDPANDLAAERLAANFVADEGVELVLDLVSGGTAVGPLDRLERQFDQWWDAGRPALPDHPKVLVSPWVPDAERKAQAHLDAQLPPGTAYGVFVRRRKLAGGRSEDLGWFCTIEDGPATSGGRGDSPLAAARAAVDAWRAFVAGREADVIQDAAPAELAVDADDELQAKPPKLDAPSAPARDAGGQADRKVS